MGLIYVFQQFASSMVMKLQLVIAKLNANLEEQSDNVCQNMPRILADIESLEQEAFVLQSKMSAVQKEIDTVNRETGESFNRLIELDTLKERIQSTNAALKEADKWTSLVTNVEDALDDGADLAATAEKIAALTQSLKILTRVNDYDERSALLEGYKNRLEALASPQLVAAFNSNDAVKAKAFVDVFVLIERPGVLRKYYRRCLETRLLKKWATLVEERQDESVLEWTKLYFKHLTTEFKNQTLWYPSVFTSSEANSEAKIDLTAVATQVFANLNPGLEFCLDASLKHTDQSQIDYAIAVKEQLKNIYNELCDISGQRGNYIFFLIRDAFPSASVVYS